LIVQCDADEAIKVVEMIVWRRDLPGALDRLVPEEGVEAVNMAALGCPTAPT
jgi:hypothetical protein